MKYFLITNGKQKAIQTATKHASAYDWSFEQWSNSYPTHQTLRSHKH